MTTDVPRSKLCCRQENKLQKCQVKVILIKMPPMGGSNALRGVSDVQRQMKSATPEEEVVVT